MVARAATGGEDDPDAGLAALQPIAIAHHLCRRWANGLDEHLGTVPVTAAT